MVMCGSTEFDDVQDVNTADDDRSLHQRRHQPRRGPKTRWSGSDYINFRILSIWFLIALCVLLATVSLTHTHNHSTANCHEIHSRNAVIRSLISQSFVSSAIQHQTVVSSIAPAVRTSETSFYLSFLPAFSLHTCGSMSVPSFVSCVPTFVSVSCSLSCLSVQSTACKILSRSSDVSAHSTVKEPEVTKDGAHKMVRSEALLMELEAAKQELQDTVTIEVYDKNMDQLRDENSSLRRELVVQSRRDRVDESEKIALVEKVRSPSRGTAKFVEYSRGDRQEKKQPQGQGSTHESSAVLGTTELELLKTDMTEVMSRMEADIRKKDEQSDGLEGASARAQEEIGVLKVRHKSEQLGRVHVVHAMNIGGELDELRLELSRLNEVHSELDYDLDNSSYGRRSR